MSRPATEAQRRESQEAPAARRGATGAQRRESREAPAARRGATAAVTRCLLAAALLPLAWIAGAADSPPAGNVANGQRLFMADGCYACHGTTGAGGGIAGPRIAPNPLPLIGLKSKLRTASGRMPVFSEAVLKESEIIDIYAYLQSIPAGKSAREIDLLSH